MASTRRREGNRVEAGSTATPDAGIELVPLPHNVAVELLAAAVNDFAELHGIRILTIKGRVLADQGLRAVRGSSDVDVLVDPSAFERLWAILRSSGWTDRDRAVLVDLPREGTVLAPHARTLEHPQWPCHLDLHRYYPGFLNPAQDVFDTLWEARTTIDLAHRACPVPGVADHWLIAALHATRSRDAGQLADLEERATPRLSTDLSDLAERAHLTGAAGPLRETLRDLTGVTVTLTPEADRLTALWRRRIESPDDLPETLAEQFAGASWSTRVRLAARKLVPSPRFAQAFFGVADDPISLLRFYLHRIVTAPVKLFRILAASRRRRP